MPGANKPSLIALRDRRDEVIDWLTEQFAGDVLDLDEFEERVDRAHRADAIATLDELVADLEPPATGSAAAATTAEESPTPGTAMVPHAGSELINRPQRKRAIAIMGGVERKGNWMVPGQLTAVAIMGGVDLDFREVELPPGVTEVKCTAIMGGVDIIVPPDLAVSCDGIGIMGGFDGVDRMPATPDPDAPLLVIKGVAIMGGVDVKTRLPGESGWQAHKRRRRERRQLRHKHREQLRARRNNKQLGDGDE